jgi:anti-anti-sigma regulatory factor
VIDETAPALRHSVVTLSTFQKSEPPHLKYGASFHIRVIRSEHDASVLILLGELDINSLTQFEMVITETLSTEPPGLVFDLTQSEFVSAQGYDAIGRCSLEIPVEVWSRTGVAARVFGVLGYDRVNVVTTGTRLVDPRC